MLISANLSVSRLGTQGSCRRLTGGMDNVRARLTAYRQSRGQDSTEMQEEPLPPNILWGQRTNTILLTVDLSDIRDETFSLEEKVFRFSGVGGDEGKRYDVEITFYKEVVTKKFKHKKTEKGLFFEFKKKAQGDYWPRLLSEPVTYPYIHLDFSHWGEEEEEEKADESDTEKEKEKQAKQTNPKETVTPPPASTPWYMIALYVILWLLIWGFFIEIEFGVVYLLTSAFAFIFLSLRGSRRRIGELSAYSVFNENCESLQGTLTAEQFEREIRYGPTSVR